MLYGCIVVGVENFEFGCYGGEVVVVIGVLKGLIVVLVVVWLFDGGVIVIVIIFKFDEEWLVFYCMLYCDYVCYGVVLWLVVVNMVFYFDVDVLVEWIGIE